MTPAITGQAPAGFVSNIKPPMRGSAGNANTAPQNASKAGSGKLTAPPSAIKPKAHPAVEWMAANKTPLLVGIISAVVGGWVLLQIARR